MRFRKLRIAWSVGWGVTATLAIVLWVRSYWAAQIINRYTEGLWYEGIRSENGVICIWANGNDRIEFDVNGMDPDDPAVRQKEDPNGTKFQAVGWTYETDYPRLSWPGFGFGWLVDDYEYGFNAPYWFIAGISGILAVGPWTRQIRWRFTLRTLLIVTTLVAVVLGLIVWSVG